MTRHLGALAVAAALLLAGCGSPSTDEAAPSSSAPSSEPTSTMTPFTPPPGPIIPFRDYLASINVTAQPVPFTEAPGLDVQVPVPQGWARANEPIFATGLEFVRKIGGAEGDPSATLMAIRLDGNFDPKEAIRHANVDSLPPRSTDVTESFDDYQGWPSAVAEGRSDGAQRYSRYLIATVPSSGQRYLVQLTAANPGDQPIAEQPELSSIIDGFTVTTK